MAGTTELITRELELANFGGREPHPVDHSSRHDILINPELRDVKSVDDIFGIQSDVDGPVDWDLKNRRSKIVFCVWIVGIISEHVVVGNKASLGLAELTVRTGVLKRKAELVSGDADLKRIRRRS